MTRLELVQRMLGMKTTDWLQACKEIDELESQVARLKELLGRAKLLLDKPYATLGADQWLSDYGKEIGNG